MRAAHGPDVSFKVLLTIGWFALARFPGAASTGEPLQSSWTSASPRGRPGEGAAGWGQGGWALACPC